MSPAPAPPRRVVKNTAKHGGHHGGAWKVAYADFVTAMMALFIVLWIVGQNQTVRQAVAAHFKDPTGLQKGGPALLPGGGQPALVAVPRPGDGEGREAERGERERLEAIASSLREQLHSQANLARLRDKIQIEVTRDGLRIQLVETGQGVFFDVGSAQIKPGTREVLGIIAREIGTLPNQVVLEGHTDTRPYTGAPQYSNWELSADRANAARRILDTSGLAPGQIESVVGYADRHLANAADPLDAANRRISIIVRFRTPPPRAARP
ncbi:MAG: flagellar motor protein MotB [Candidatus Methylomirabilales bacterium]